MQCVGCGFDNPADAKFCEQCGASLARACPRCGHEVGPNARFCRACGAPLHETAGPSIVETATPTAPAPVHYTPEHLAARIRDEHATKAARGKAEGERKTITVLFADMAGSTALILDRDPEDARRLIDPVLALMMEAVHHYDGYVAKSLGDGILALFGAPLACEDHVRRALYAALRMQEAMSRYSDQVRIDEGVPLELRVGVHTGEVVVRSIRTEDLQTDYDPVGQTINIASRMEGIAPPGSILVSQTTWHLAEGFFQFKALGATKIKGVAEPVPVYEVLGVGTMRTRLQVAASRGLAHFVGRRSELDRLNEALLRARAGQGQVAAVVGEPGVGKSRLFHEFKQHLRKEALVLETFSVSHGKAFPYLPLIELLRNYFQISPRDDERVRREKIAGKVLALDRRLEDSQPYLLYLLGVAEPDSPLSQMDVNVRRQRTFDAIKRLLIGESLDRLLVVVFEDLQWLDRETEAFLDYLVEGIAGARVLLLVNFRPEYQHDWRRKGYYSQMRLDPLGRDESEALLDSLLGDDVRVAPLKPLIMAQTEGNPFFIEEVVQTLLEEQVLSGARGQCHLEQVPEALHIPTTVQGVLSTRIDRLAPAEKDLLQTLSVIGRAFPWSLILRLADRPEADLRRQLTRLQAGEFIYERPAFPEVEYTFKHGLTQEVAYGSLLQTRRAQLHERTGEAIEALYGDNLDDHCSELAHHYSRGGNVAKAVEYLQRAAQQAVQRSANREAATQIDTALEMLRTLPQNAERDHRELELQVMLGPALMAILGIGTPEVEQAYTRALALCRRLGETVQLFPILAGLRRFYIHRTDFATAQELAEQMLRLAGDDQEHRLQAHYAMGAVQFFQGRFVPAQTHFEQCMTLYEPERDRSQAFRYSIEPGVLSRCFLAWIHWYRGYPDRALEACTQLVNQARETSPVHVLHDPLIFLAELHLLRREPQQTQEWAEAAMTLSIEEGLPFWHARGAILRGWALAAQGRRKEGIAQLRDGLAAYAETGAMMLRPSYLAMQAEALAAGGDADAALAALSEAQAAVDRSGEGYYEAEICRLRGEIQAQQSPTPENVPAKAEASLRRAIEIARRQEAKSLELRALLGLVKLKLCSGDAAETGQQLSECYSGFTEGFDTADLHDAKALLDQLEA